MPIYLKIEGAAGAFPGGFQHKHVGRLEWTEVTSARLGQAPVVGDLNRGASSGKRQHMPVVIRMQMGPLHSKLYDYYKSGEQLKSVQIDFCLGQLTQHSVTLTNAVVAKVTTHGMATEVTFLFDGAQRGSQPGHKGGGGTMEDTEFDFVFRQITWTHQDKGKTSTDSWDATK